jgi:molybdate transport system regulatory protein
MNHVSERLPSVSLRGAIWLSVGDSLLADRRRIELLAQIEALGSITRAAKAIGLSYKFSWDAIDAMNAVAGVPLVAKTAGGKGGGGTRLTGPGLALVKRYLAIEAQHQRCLEEIDCGSAALKPSEDERVSQRVA